MGFKGSRKSTPYAAQVAAEDAAKKAQEHGMRTLEVEVVGPGFGPRVGAARAAGRRLHDHLDPRRDADPAQRLPAAQASARVTSSFGRACGPPAAAEFSPRGGWGAQARPRH